MINQARRLQGGIRGGIFKNFGQNSRGIREGIRWRTELENLIKQPFCSKVARLNSFNDSIQFKLPWFS